MRLCNIVLSAWLLIALGVEAKVLTVSAEGDADFQRIQAAINAAEPGDTVQVMPGVYQEAIVIKKEVYLKGSGAESTRIEYSDEQMVVQVHTVKKGEISGFTIAYVGDGRRSTVWLSNANITLTDNVITGGFFSGISLTHGADPTVTKNRIEHNRRNGMQISGSTGTVTENVIHSNGQNGIRIIAGMSPTISANEIHGNQQDGVQVTDRSTALIYKNRIFENKLNGVYVELASTVAVRRNWIEDNAGNGVVFSSESAGEILGNVCARNDHHGILVRDSAQLELVHNTIVQNQRSGLAVYDGGTPVVQHNIVAYNQIGVTADTGAGDPFLDRNNVWGNTQHDYQSLSAAMTDLSVEPGFVDVASGNYYLLNDSPMLGATPDKKDIGALPLFSEQVFNAAKGNLGMALTRGTSSRNPAPAPVISIDPPRTENDQIYPIAVGQHFQLRITAAQGESISHSLLPMGATYDAETGLFQWQPDKTQLGETQITFTAKAASGQITERQVKLLVWKQNRPPQVTRVDGRALKPFESLAYTTQLDERLSVAFEAEDPDNDPLLFTAINLPPEARMEGGLLTWTPKQPQPTEFPILVVVSDGQEIDAVDVVLRVGTGRD